MNASQDQQRAVLEIPGDTAHVQLARLVAAGLAGRLEFDIDEIEDLRIGVDECCVAVLECARNASPLRLEYAWSGDELRLTGSVLANGGGEPQITGITRQILSAVLDDVRFERNSEAVCFELRKSRHTAS
jgi:serine/threonine-protein kinase RsbW